MPSVMPIVNLFHIESCLVVESRKDRSWRKEQKGLLVDGHLYSGEKEVGNEGGKEDNSHNRQHMGCYLVFLN